MFKLIVRLALMALAAPLAASGAHAQAKFPERTIRLVVPNVDADNVDQLANRRGLGGRHRRPSA